MADWGQTANTRNTDDAWNLLRTDFEQELPKIQAWLDGIGAAAADTEVAEVAVTTVITIPFALSALADLGFALFLAGMVWIINWLLGWIGRVIPNPGIFGFHPLGFIKSGLETGSTDLQNAMDSCVLRVRDAILVIAHTLTGMFKRLHRATARVQNNVAHTNKVVIPAAQQFAIATANGHTDQSIADLDSDISAARWNWEQHHTEADALADITLANLRGGVTYDLLGMMARTLLAADQHADTNLAQAESYTDQSSAAVAKQAHAELAQTEADLVKRLQGDEGILSSLTYDISTEVPTEIAKAVSDSYNKEQANLVSTAQSLQKELETIQKEIDSLAARITADEATIADNTAKLVQLQSAETTDATAITAAQKAISTAQSDIATSQTAISDLQKTIAAQGDTLAQVQTAQVLNTSQLGTFETVGAPTLVATIAALAGGLSSLKTEVDQCSVTTCYGPNNISNVLKKVLQDLLAAGELGFIYEAIHDPTGTANVVSPTLETIDSLANATLGQLLELLA